MFGTIAHTMIEAEAKGRDPFEVLERIDLDNTKLFKKEIEMYGNIILDMHDIMTDYFDFWKGQLKVLPGPDGSMAEHEFRIELEPGLWFTGKIDLIGKAKGMRWLVEHKTFNRMPNEDDRWRSVQSAVYFRALEMVGFKRIDGVLWDYISSRPPAIPAAEKLKSGAYSQARLNTIPSRIKRWLKDEELRKSDYAKLVQDAKDNRRNYFIRLYSPIKTTIVDDIWEDFLITAREIAELHGKRKDQNIGRHCTWCDFKDLCKAEAVGSDVDWIIKREYTTEPEKRTLIDGDDRSED